MNAGRRSSHMSVWNKIRVRKWFFFSSHTSGTQSEECMPDRKKYCVSQKNCLRKFSTFFPSQNTTGSTLSCTLPSIRRELTKLSIKIQWRRLKLQRESCISSLFFYFSPCSTISSHLSPYLRPIATTLQEMREHPLQSPMDACFKLMWLDLNSNFNYLLAADTLKSHLRLSV